MEQFPLSELSIGLASVSAIIIIVKLFMGHLSSKDKEFKEVIKEHNEIVTKHLSDSNESRNKLISSNYQMTKAHEALNSTQSKMITTMSIVLDRIKK